MSVKSVEVLKYVVIINLNQIVNPAEVPGYVNHLGAILTKIGPQNTKAIVYYVLLICSLMNKYLVIIKPKR
jgi:hypothetical protein